MKAFCFLFYVILFSGTIIGQQEPTMQPFQTTNIGSEFQVAPSAGSSSNIDRSYKVPNAKEVLYQQQKASAERMGVPYYPVGSTPEQNRRINEEYAKKQMQEQFNQPNAENNFRQGTEKQSTQQELFRLMNESYGNRAKMTKLKYKVSPRYYEDLPNYLKAKQEIKDQLSGKKDLSLKDAYYFAEAAFGNIHLDYEEYNELIQDNKNYILGWLAQKGYDLNDPEALHYGIQSFLSDTLYLQVDDPDEVFGGSHQVMHTPFYYDYIDNGGIEDRRNLFVTKTLATGSGQCSTLPQTYLILAEALGIEANLTFIPLHSTIRYKNNDGVTLNYETTVDRFLPDQAYLDMQPSMAKGMKNGIFLKDMSKKQTVATILIDLGVNFILEHWFADETIVDDCIVTAERYFPHEEYVNTSSLWIKKKTLSNRFNLLVEEKGIEDLNEIRNFPEVEKAFFTLNNFLKKAKELGLEEFPESEYISMMSYHDDQARLQKAKGIDTKSEKNLFIKR